MSRKTKQSLSLLPLGAGLLLVGFAGYRGAAPAQDAEPTVYYACYVPSAGVVYRIKEAGLPDACRSDKHVLFSWNARGPKGDPGSPGASGANGLNCWDLNGNGVFDLATEDRDGDGVPTAQDCQGAGSAGTLEVQEKAVNSYTLQGGSGVTDIGQCDAGWTALSGEWSMSTGQVRDLAVVENRSDGASGWRFTVYNTNSDNRPIWNLTVSLYIRCARLGS